MKKIFVVAAAFMMLGAGTAMAAPMNHLTGNETAVGGKQFTSPPGYF